MEDDGWITSHEHKERGGTYATTVTDEGEDCERALERSTAVTSTTARIATVVLLLSLQLDANNKLVTTG